MSNSKQVLEPLPRQPASNAKGVSVVDTVANITNINAKLPVELVQRLLLFVDARRCKNFKPNNSAEHENVGAVIISRQFDLRYVCLLWHNIFHRSARVGLGYGSTEKFWLFNHLPRAHLSVDRRDVSALQHRIKEPASMKAWLHKLQRSKCPIVFVLFSVFCITVQNILSIRLSLCLGVGVCLVSNFLPLSLLKFAYIRAPWREPPIFDPQLCSLPENRFRSESVPMLSISKYGFSLVLADSFCLTVWFQHVGYNKRNGSWYSLVDSIQSIRVCVRNSESRDKSILFALRNATNGIDQPLDLDLSLTEESIEATGSLVRDPHADFEKLHPNLTLRDLSLKFADFSAVEMTEDQFADIKECANYCFSIGRQSLSRAKVQLSALDGLPEDWTCETLKDLDLNVRPLGYWRLGEWSAERMLQEFDKQARVPQLFPGLEEITLRCSSDWPHFDFACLNQLARLKTLKFFASMRNAADWRLAALPHIQTLQLLHYDGVFPMSLREFVPSVKHLKIDPKYAGACVDLLSELGVAGTVLNQLEHLRQLDDISPPADVVALFAGLRQLPALTSLEFALTEGRSAEWCRPGDLSLLYVLPPQLRTASLDYCLIPAAVAPGTEEVNFIYDPNIVDAQELIYTTWFVTVIHRLCRLPKLERFHCKIVAPSFSAAVSLAEKWSKSSSAAIADLGLASVIGVSCSTDAYLSIEPGQTCRTWNTLKFRFTLAPRPDLLDKKFASRVFTFELRFPRK